MGKKALAGGGFLATFSPVKKWHHWYNNMNRLFKIDLEG
jgi:hypothetical protein